MHIKTALGMHISVFQVGRNVYNYVLCLEINLAHNGGLQSISGYPWCTFFFFQSLWSDWKKIKKKIFVNKSTLTNVTVVCTCEISLWMALLARIRCLYILWSYWKCVSASFQNLIFCRSFQRDNQESTGQDCKLPEEARHIVNSSSLQQR